MLPDPASPEPNYSLLDMPWRLANEARRYAALPFHRAAFALHGVRWPPGLRAYGLPMIQRHRGSQILLGEGVSLRSWPQSNPLSPNHAVVLSTRSASAVLSIGAGSGLTGATIVAEERVEIGERVFVGANAVIVDTDFHPLDPSARRATPSDGRHAPVLIADDVFIGMNALILKGVTVGAGAVVGAGSVVVRDVPPLAVVSGNPAVVIRYLNPSREAGR